MDWLRMRATPATPFSAVSSGMVMSCSTSSEDRPGPSVITVTMPWFRSGSTSTGRRVAVTAP